MVGFIEATAREHGIADPLQMTIGTSDGERVWAFRLHEVAEETRLIVSEPLGDLAGAWNVVPESGYGLVHHGHDELHPFRPRSMPAAVG